MEAIDGDGALGAKRWALTVTSGPTRTFCSALTLAKWLNDETLYVNRPRAYTVEDVYNLSRGRLSKSMMTHLEVLLGGQVKLRSMSKIYQQ